MWTFQMHAPMFMIDVIWGLFKYPYELFIPRALKFSAANKIHIFQCKIFCMEFQRESLKFQTKYLTHTFKDMFSYNVEFLKALRFMRCGPGLDIKPFMKTWWMIDGDVEESDKFLSSVIIYHEWKLKLTIIKAQIEFRLLKHHIHGLVQGRCNSTPNALSFLH